MFLSQKWLRWRSFLLKAFFVRPESPAEIASVKVVLTLKDGRGI
jgi:hypothetical protein